MKKELQLMTCLEPQREKIEKCFQRRYGDCWRTKVCIVFSDNLKYKKDFNMIIGSLPTELEWQMFKGHGKTSKTLEQAITWEEIEDEIIAEKEQDVQIKTKELERAIRELTALKAIQALREK